MTAVTCCEKFGNIIGLNCCLTYEDFKNRDLAEVVQNKQRRCTDVPCLLVLIAVFVSQFFLIFYSVGEGSDPELLWRGVDYKGHVCDASNKDGRYAAWPNLPLSYNVKVCVKECNATRSNYLQNSASQMSFPYASEDYLGAWCLPKHPSNFSSTYSFSSSQQTYERAVADLDTAKWIILVMSLVTILTSFAYLRMVACIGKILIYLTIALVFIGGTLLCWLLMDRGLSDIKHGETRTTGKVEIGIASALALFLFCLLVALLFMRKAIALALEMLDEASHAINDIKTTLIFPVIYSFVGLAYFAFWIIVAVYIYSVKTTSDEDMPTGFGYLGRKTYVRLHFEKSMQDALIYHIVILYYIVQVIIYFCFMVVAGTIADWYFSKYDPSGHKKVRGDGPAELSYSPVCESFGRVLRFHLGTLSFGAIVMTLIRVLRAVVLYLEKITKGAGNPFTRCIFGCVSCCLRCCQCIFDRIAKEGFIFTTIYGSAFCFASFQALQLLAANLARTFMVGAVSRLTEVFGRVAIASLNTGIACLVMYYLKFYQTHVSSFVFPAMIIFVMSYTIASIFMMVLEVAVDTIFLSFLIDETVHKPPRFASKKLLKMVSLTKSDVVEDNAKNVNSDTINPV